MNGHDDGLPLEEFIQALTSQLDRAQETMALKVHAGYPLTFAVRDLTIDLRTHIGMTGSIVRIRPAGPGDAEASVIHLALTTITKPMIQENTRALATEQAPTIKEALGDQISEDEQRRLEWAGVTNVSQLRELQQQGGENALERVAQLPVERLRAALSRASQPHLSAIHADGPFDAAGGLLRVHGFNLADGGDPSVKIGEQTAEVLSATDRVLVVRVPAGAREGTLAVSTASGSAARAFELADAADAGEPS